MAIGKKTGHWQIITKKNTVFTTTSEMGVRISNTNWKFPRLFQIYNYNFASIYEQSFLVSVRLKDISWSVVIDMAAFLGSFATLGIAFVRGFYSTIDAHSIPSHLCTDSTPNAEVGLFYSLYYKSL